MFWADTGSKSTDTAIRYIISYKLYQTFLTGFTDKKFHIYLQVKSKVFLPFIYAKHIDPAISCALFEIKHRVAWILSLNFICEKRLFNVA